MIDVHNVHDVHVNAKLHEKSHNAVSERDAMKSSTDNNVLDVNSYSHVMIDVANSNLTVHPCVSSKPESTSSISQTNPVVSQATPNCNETRVLTSNQNRNLVVPVRPLVPMPHRNHVSSKDSTVASPCTEAPSSPRFGQLRKPVFVGCWNVTTLLDPGAQSLTMRSLHSYRVGICCLSEIRIRGNGSKCIKVPGVDTCYWLYYSGPEDNSGTAGVGVALSSSVHNSVISWEPVSPRIAVIRLAGKPQNVTIISVYAPTLPSDQSNKDHPVV